MHKKHHEKFKILDILAVTTQAREGIETNSYTANGTAANGNNSSPRGHWNNAKADKLKAAEVTTQAREGIETIQAITYKNGSKK